MAVTFMFEILLHVVAAAAAAAVVVVVSMCSLLICTVVQLKMNLGDNFRVLKIKKDLKKNSESCIDK